MNIYIIIEGTYDEGYEILEVYTTIESASQRITRIVQADSTTQWMPTKPKLGNSTHGLSFNENEKHLIPHWESGTDYLTVLKFAIQ